MFLHRIARIDHIKIAKPRMIIQPYHFFRWVLQIIIHGDDVSAARMAQPGHHRVMLTKIACMFYIGQRHRRTLLQGAADIAGIIRAAIIHQHNFDAAFGAQRR